MDKEYIILESINNNSMVTQRELSKRLGISLGSINILINKMVRDGLIKIEKANTNVIFYMLTPKGFIEKMNKTYKYITIHYKYITEVKDKIKKQLVQIMDSEKEVAVILEKDETSDLAYTAIKELGNHNITLCWDNDGLINMPCLVVVLSSRLYSIYESAGFRVINIMEKI